MRFRRHQSDPNAGEATELEVSATPPEGAPAGGEDVVTGPVDIDHVDEDVLEGRIDLGSLIIPPVQGVQLRMQVDESTKEVQAVLLTGPDGAMELMAFAAPRGGELWDEVRPQIAADMTRRGGTAEEATGPWGGELACRLQVDRGDGNQGVQPSRIIGVDGPRWMLRATLLGRPALDAEAGRPWERVLMDVVVRRGTEPRGIGEQLPIVLPPDARPADDA